MTEGDAALGEIVRGEFHGDAIACEDADAVAAETAGEVGEDHAFVLKLDAEQAAGEFFEDGAGYFDAIFFAQIIAFPMN